MNDTYTEHIVKALHVDLDLEFKGYFYIDLIELIWKLDTSYFKTDKITFYIQNW